MSFFKELRRLPRPVWGWALYDFANSGFSTVIVTVVYSVYFTQVVVGQKATGELYWGWAMSASQLLVALVSPWLGALADAGGTKKKWLLYHTLACILATGCLYWVGPGDIAPGMLLFILANYAFNAAYVFYNAFLTEIAPVGKINLVSGLAWGIGYLGGMLSLIATLPFKNESTPWAFPVTAGIFALFSLFTFAWLKEAPAPVARAGFGSAWHRLNQTFHHLRRLPDLWRYTLSYFLFNDGIVVVISFASIYAVDIFKFTTGQVTIFFIAMQVTAFLGSIILGRWGDKKGTKPALLISLFIWLAITIASALCYQVWLFYVIGALAGAVMGGSQSLARSLLAELTPAGRKAEFFGFFSLTGRLGAVMGPLVYGYTAWLTGSQRWAAASMSLFFIGGIILLAGVHVARGKRVAKMSF